MGITPTIYREGTAQTSSSIVGAIPRGRPLTEYRGSTPAHLFFGYPLRLLARRGLAYALNLTEEAMHLIINTSGKEERVGWTSGCAIAKLQSPQTIDHNWISSVTFKLTDTFAGFRVVSIDAPIAEIADQQIIAELAKIRGSERQAPGRVELAM